MNKALKRFINVVVIVVILYFIFALSKGGDKISPKGKVLLIGIDAMDYKATAKLMAEGKLPNFKKLAETGAFLKLETSNPPESPVAWTSISTGTNPGKHNMFDFIIRDPQTYLPELSITSQKGFGGSYASLIRATPFWELTSKAGIPTSVIRWPATFPPEKVNGNLFSGLGVPDIKGFLSGYAFYTEEDIDKQKVIHVTKEGSSIHTNVLGPKVRKFSKIEDVKEGMDIEITDEYSAILTIDGREYQLDREKWSDWVKVKFDAGFLRSVHGMFKAYLISTEPFQMYITTVQIDPTNPIVDISSPKGYAKELADELGLYYTLGMPEETDGYVNGFLDEKAFLSQVYEIEKEREAMFWKEFNEFKEKETGVLAFAFDSSDRLQHLFWDNKVLTNISDEIVMNEVLTGYYMRKDELLGKIMKEVGNDTMVLIFSDHGFSSFERAVNINTWLSQNGFMKLNTVIKQGVEDSLFEYVIWDETKAYSVGFSSIYINLEGREKHGTVSIDDKEAVENEIIEKLENLTDPKTGRKVINKVYRRGDIYSGDSLENAPDLIIGFNPGYRMEWQSAIGGFTRNAILDNTKKWQGDHLIDPTFVPGVLFSNKQINQDSASLVDIAPTVLNFLNISMPEQIDGKPLLK